MRMHDAYGSGRLMALLKPAFRGEGHVGVKIGMSDLGRGWLGLAWARSGPSETRLRFYEFFVPIKSQASPKQAYREWPTGPGWAGGLPPSTLAGF